MDYELNKLKNNNKKKIIFLVLTIILSLGISFAAVYYAYIYKDSRENTLQTGLISIDFLESSNVIDLTNTVPVIDEVGLENDPYTFTVTNTSTVPINAKIQLEMLATANQIPLSAVKYAFYINGILKIKDNIKSDDDITLYTIENFQPNETVNCKLIFWVDYYYEEPNKTFSAKVKATGESFDLIVD